MLRYEFERVKLEATSYVPWGRSVAGGTRELIEARAADGWRYVGLVPVSVTGKGGLELFDLVFEKEA